MNKIEALKAAQELQMKIVSSGKWCSICIRSLPNRFVVIIDGGEIEIFPFEEPKPLARNSVAMCFDGMVRCALGEILNGIHKFAKPGYTADTNLDNRYDGLKDGEFEIIEAPTELETMQTPDAVCMYRDCKQYRYKYVDQEPSEPCQSCRISVSEPTGMKGE